MQHRLLQHRMATEQKCSDSSDKRYNVLENIV